jgi:hypothetical protein
MALMLGHEWQHSTYQLAVMSNIHSPAALAALAEVDPRHTEMICVAFSNPTSVTHGPLRQPAPQQQEQQQPWNQQPHHQLAKQATNNDNDDQSSSSTPAVVDVKSAPCVSAGHFSAFHVWMCGVLPRICLPQATWYQSCSTPIRSHDTKYGFLPLPMQLSVECRSDMSAASIMLPTHSVYR